MAGDQPHPFRRHTHRRGKVVAHPERALARGVQRVALRLPVKGSDRRARLDRVHHDAAVDDAQPGDMRGAGKGRRDLAGIAEMVVEDHIAGDVVIELRRARFDGIFAGRDRGKDLDVEQYGLGGIARLNGGAGHDHRDGVPDKPHFVGRQCVAGRLPDRAAVTVRHLDNAFQQSVALAREIVASIDRDDALHRLGVRDIDAAQDAMRVRAADEGGVELPLQRDIVGIAALATHKDRVLVARDRLADLEWLRRKLR